ncbi:MAG: MATE family efflux transporter [Candidatus Cryptobacteroides sp.]
MNALTKRLNKEILRLAIPSIFANITVPIVGMADIAIAGHLGDGDGTAVMIGAIAIGSMLFDLLYWNFAFLRAGTGGLTAQAFGQGDRRECAMILSRALTIAIACSLFLIAIQWIFVKGAFLVLDCSPQVGTLARQYFFIRIWAAPATLSLMAIKGWFIGMQDSVSPMVTDILVNVLNVVLSLLLATGRMGFSGIAAGTVAAQYCGLLCALGIIFFKYRKNTLSRLKAGDLKEVFKGDQTRRFFTTNTDLFIRSLCFIAIYIGFTAISARYGDILLATCSILMKILMIFSYFTDGFAYAGEAMTGRYIGENNPTNVYGTIKWTFAWSMSIALLFMGIYGFGGELLLKMMTSDAAVVSASMKYIPWLLLMPVAGCAAFTWDGIYIGATASKEMRDSMIWATVGFFATFVLGILFIDNILHIDTTLRNEVCVHILMAAYFVHLIARTIYLSVKYKNIISSGGRHRSSRSRQSQSGRNIPEDNGSCTHPPA